MNSLWYIEASSNFYFRLFAFCFSIKPVLSQTSVCFNCSLSSNFILIFNIEETQQSKVEAKETLSFSFNVLQRNNRQKLASTIFHEGCKTPWKRLPVPKKLQVKFSVENCWKKYPDTPNYLHRKTQTNEQWHFSLVQEEEFILKNKVADFPTVFSETNCKITEKKMKKRTEKVTYFTFRLHQLYLTSPDRCFS